MKGWSIFEGPKGVLLVSLANTNGARKWAGPEGALDEHNWPSKDLWLHCRDGLSSSMSGMVFCDLDFRMNLGVRSFGNSGRNKGCSVGEV